MEYFSGRADVTVGEMRDGENRPAEEEEEAMMGDFCCEWCK